MSGATPPPLHVVLVWAFLDPLGRAPAELLAGWKDFGRLAAAAVAAGPGLRVTMVLAAWEDGVREIEGIACHFVRERGHPHLRLPGGRVVRRRPRRLFQRVATLAPDLLHYEGLVHPRVLRGLAAVVPGVPVFVQDHGSRVPNGWRRWLFRWGFAPLAGVSFTARAQAEPFKRAGVLRRDLPVFEVLEGSTSFRPGDANQARAASGLDGDPCLLWAGNLDANKDPLVVLDAVARAAPALPGLRLHMSYRRAPLLAPVRARIEGEPALAGRVTLHGEIPYAAMEACFRAADFLIQASHVEGSGFAAIEALACGATPLVTDIPSFRRITGDGAYGALVPVGDAAALARALTAWSGRDRAALRRRAREHFDRALSFSAAGRELRAAYDQVRGAR